MTDTQLDEVSRAAIGAAWLDTVHPDWYTHIDLAKLDLWSWSCVIGQLTEATDRTTVDALHALSTPGGEDPWLTHGFDCGAGGGIEEYDNLRNAWIAEINQRRSA